MEIKVLDETDIDFMEEVLTDDGMIFNKDNIKNFINSPNAYGFILKDENQIIGFAYGHSLARPDGKNMFYLHDVGVLEKYRNKGNGTEFMKFIVDFAKTNGFKEIFVITDRNNPRACHVYEKVGFINEIPDEVCYVCEFDS